MLAFDLNLFAHVFTRFNVIDSTLEVAAWAETMLQHGSFFQPPLSTCSLPELDYLRYVPQPDTADALPKGDINRNAAATVFVSAANF
jgi:hypothetical protein